MGQEHTGTPVFAGTFDKKIMAGMAGGHLDGDLSFLGATLDVCPGNLKGQFMKFSQLPHESCIMDGEKTAQLVIEMTENELFGACLEEGMK